MKIKILTMTVKVKENILNAGGDKNAHREARCNRL